jgi:hypothetical protein
VEASQTNKQPVLHHRCGNSLACMLCCAVLQVPLPRPPADCPPVFVLGGEDDKVLDVQAYQELARCNGWGGLSLH